MATNYTLSRPLSLRTRSLIVLGVALGVIGIVLAFMTSIAVGGVLLALGGVTLGLNVLIAPRAPER